ncbi:MAG: preprotein translocase subunit SecE [Anaerolineales bacterium]
MAKAQVVKRKRGNPISRYLRETSGELKKVTWPTRPDALRLTGLVLVVVFISSAVLGLFDYVFAQLVRFIISLG